MSGTTKEQALIRVFNSLKPWLTKRRTLDGLNESEKQALTEAFEWTLAAIDDAGIRDVKYRLMKPRNSGEVALDLVRTMYGSLVHHQDEKWVKWMLDSIYDSDLQVARHTCAGCGLTFSGDTCRNCKGE